MENGSETKEGVVAGLTMEDQVDEEELLGDREGVKIAPVREGD